MTDLELYKFARKAEKRALHREQMLAAYNGESSRKNFSLIVTGVAIWKAISWIALAIVTIMSLKSLVHLIKDTIPGFFTNIKEWRKASKNVASQKDKIEKQSKRIQIKQRKLSLMCLKILEQAKAKGQLHAEKTSKNMQKLLAYYTSPEYKAILEGKQEPSKQDMKMLALQGAELQAAQEQSGSQEQGAESAEDGSQEEQQSGGAVKGALGLAWDLFGSSYVSGMPGKIVAKAGREKMEQELLSRMVAYKSSAAAVQKAAAKTVGATVAKEAGKQAAAATSAKVLAAKAGTYVIKGAAKMNAMVAGGPLSWALMVGDIGGAVFGGVAAHRIASLGQQFEALQGQNGKLDEQEAILDKQIADMTKMVQGDMAKVDELLDKQLQKEGISKKELRSLKIAKNAVHRAVDGINGISGKTEMAVSFSAPVDNRSMSDALVSLGRNIGSVGMQAGRTGLNWVKNHKGETTAAALGIVAGMAIQKYRDRKREKEREELEEQTIRKYQRMGRY